MDLKLLLITYLTCTSLSQIAVQTNGTLDSLSRSHKGRNPEDKAMQFLLLSYPELANYHNITVSRIQRGNNPYNLQDIYFTLHNNTTRTSIIATLSQADPGEFISFSPLVTTIPGSNGITSSALSSKDDSNFYIISGDEVKVINTGGNHTQRMVMPGGFQQFNLGNDTRLERAQALLASLHPEMINYRAEKIQYQIVSGIKFEIEYMGSNGMTSVAALVLVNLSLQPYLLGFQVRCQAANISDLALPCTDSLAFQIFSACQLLILVHPELLAYEMISMVSDDINQNDGILFILTYQNTQTNMRVMAELNILDNVFNIMSYYIYAYPQ